jgi:hypothetical protein
MAELLTSEWYGTPYEVMVEWLDFPNWERIEDEAYLEQEKEALHERRGI